MLPAIDASTGYLPPGVHHAPWPEVQALFGQGDHRAPLAEGLLAALRELARVGCRTVLLNGSFVPSKPDPGDYDVAWEPTGIFWQFRDPVLLDFSNQRAAMKAKYKGELFSANMLAAHGVNYREFFLTDADGHPKGVISIDLRNLP